MQCLRWLRPMCDGFRQCGTISAPWLQLTFYIGLHLLCILHSPTFLKVVFITNCSRVSLAFTGSVLAPRQPRRTSQPYCFPFFPWLRAQKIERIRAMTFVYLNEVIRMTYFRLQVILHTDPEVCPRRDHCIVA